MYALDTNTLIYFFKGMGHVAEKLLATAPRDIAIPAVVLFELEVGIAKSRAPRKRREQLDSLVNLIHVLPFGKDEASAAARIRAQLEKRGLPIGPLDNLIAGTALAHRATLVTRNIKEFARIKGLEIQNWY
jgi:tRNA(fMet)-specific endonuclease VapC